LGITHVINLAAYIHQHPVGSRTRPSAMGWRPICG
jgi:hypothetical protein